MLDYAGSSAYPQSTAVSMNSSFSLMSPPELGQPFDTFDNINGNYGCSPTHNSTTSLSKFPNMSMCDSRTKEMKVSQLGGRPPLSPPTSPETTHMDTIIARPLTPLSPTPSGKFDDIQLYETISNDEAPLFVPQPQAERQPITVARKLVAVHSRDPKRFVALTVDGLSKAFYDPVAHWDMEKKLYDERRAARIAAKTRSEGAFTTVTPFYTPSRSPPTKRHSKPAPKSILSPRVGTDKILKPKRTVTPKPKAVHAPRLPKTTETQKDDNYSAILDFCPPLSSLAEKGLKNEWKGTILPVQEDKDRHLLHDDEYMVARRLRLTCGVYLTQKRRIFYNWVTYVKNGQKFQKTDSQKACKIDVNKASNLWTAFSNAGWFDPKWAAPYLHRV